MRKDGVRLRLNSPCCQTMSTPPRVLPTLASYSRMMLRRCGGVGVAKTENNMPSPCLTPTLPPPSIRCTTIRNTPSLARFLSLQMSRLMLLLTRKSASLLRSGRLKTLSFVRPDPPFYVFILELFSSTPSHYRIAHRVAPIRS